MAECLFISDLHLSGEQPATVALFLGFLRQRARAADALYILGDLFDTWIGDDDDRPPAPRIIEALRAVGDSGTRVFIQRGNRDFLLGETFCSVTGTTLLPDCHVLDLQGTPTLLMHGDLLCSDDLEYQQSRDMLRDPAVIQDFLARSIQERAEIAGQYRARSGEATSLKANDIMDVNTDTVKDLMSRYRVTRLIHGHTHRPGRHDVQVGGKPAERIVLAEWHENEGSVLCVSERGLQIEPVR